MSISYAPEDFGCTIVATLDKGEPYSFDTVLVVRCTETGELFGAHDQGCSCPTPFEDITTLSDMVPITSVDDLRPLLALQSEYGPSAAETFDFLNVVRAAL